MGDHNRPKQRGWSPAVEESSTIPTMAGAQGSTAFPLMPSYGVRPKLSEGPYLVGENRKRSGIPMQPSDEGFHAEGMELRRAYQVTDSGAPAGVITICVSRDLTPVLPIHFFGRDVREVSTGCVSTTQIFCSDIAQDCVHAEQSYVAKRVQASRHDAMPYSLGTVT
jgi:hypothetical protein